MTGPEHYKYAEHLIAVANQASDGIALTLAEAQVHATLALAAATAMGALDAADINTTDLDAWCAATGTPVANEQTETSR